MNLDNQSTPFELIGGKKGVQNLVERFYFHMDTLPEVTTIRLMHSENLDTAKLKLFKFLCGWLGGPDLYIQEYGHPRLRRRHLPFKIGGKERDQWLFCMDKALAEMPIDEQLSTHVRQALSQLATHMINS